MSFVRFVGILALALWIGGLAALGGTASTLFGVLEANTANGQELGGLAFGAIFERFQYIIWVAGAVLLVSMSLRAALGPRPRRFGVRMAVAVAMLAASVVSVEIIAPRIEAIRSSVPGPVASLADTDDRKTAFAWWHGASTTVMLLTIVAGTGLLWAETRDTH